MSLIKNYGSVFENITLHLLISLFFFSPDFHEIGLTKQKWLATPLS